MLGVTHQHIYSADEEKQLRFVLGILTAGLLFGCSSTYQAPLEGEPVATLTFEVDADPALGYVAYYYYFPNPNETPCLGIKTEMARINKGNPLAGKTTNLAGISVPANREIVVRSAIIPAGVMNQYGCTFDNKMTLEPGRDYLLRQEWGRDQCVVEVFELNEESELQFTTVSQSLRRQC